MSDRRTVFGGRASVRAALYMSALAGTRHRQGWSTSNKHQHAAMSSIAGWLVAELAMLRQQTSRPQLIEQKCPSDYQNRKTVSKASFTVSSAFSQYSPWHCFRNIRENTTQLISSCLKTTGYFIDESVIFLCYYHWIERLSVPGISCTSHQPDLRQAF